MVVRSDAATNVLFVHLLIGLGNNFKQICLKLKKVRLLVPCSGLKGGYSHKCWTDYE